MSTALFAVMGLGGWEVILLLAILVSLLGLKRWPQITRRDDPREPVPGSADSRARAEREARLRPFPVRFILWLAQGFGLGRIPLAPGTFGTLAGVVWLVLLISLGDPLLFAAGLLVGLALSVVVCGAAEKILGYLDPPSVVLDEITAFPICFVPWLGSWVLRQGTIPSPEFFFSDETWYMTFTLFLLFRFFDVVKPWPIRKSQSLPGGWGVTIDDCLAAIYVALLTLVFVI